MQRTKAELKKYNIQHSVVERYFPKSRKYPFGCKEDLFNIIDLIALDNGIVGLQICGTDFSPHRKTLMVTQKQSTINWLKNGGRLELWGWRKRKKVRGKKATYWSARIADILLVNGELYFEERQ